MIRRLGRAAASSSVVAVITAASLVIPAGLVAAEQEATVRMHLLGFDPEHLEVSTGTTVTWVNEEPLNYPAIQGNHHIVADDGSFDSGVLRPRQRFSMRFLAPATISYRCVIHPELMQGDLTITGPVIQPEPMERSVKIVEPSTDPQTWGFKPADVTVDAGTTITWRNDGAETHTVTADDGSFDSGNLTPGETFSFTFEEAATLRYHCTPHEWMEGLVRVAADGGSPPPPPDPPSVEADEPVTVTQPGRVGDEPATWNVLAVDAGQPLEWGFEPSSLSIRAGDEVVWQNAGSSVHTVTADGGSFDSGDLPPGDTFTLTFEQPGTIRFHCTPHPWMVGTIVVASADAQRLPEPAPVEGGGVFRGDNAAAPPASPARPADEPSPIDTFAGARIPLAVGTGGAFGGLGLVLVLPTLLERVRRRRIDG